MRRTPNRSRDFLSWAKLQQSNCCVCQEYSGTELHHFGDAGMGQKGSDFLVCRVCPECHHWIQGKRFLAFLRMQKLEVWTSIQADGLVLLEGYAARLEGIKSEK